MEGNSVATCFMKALEIYERNDKSKDWMIVTKLKARYLNTESNKQTIEN